MRIQKRPLQLFWKSIRNAPPRPGRSRQQSDCEEVRTVRRAEEMNEAIRACLEKRRK